MPNCWLLTALPDLQNNQEKVFVFCSTKSPARAGGHFFPLELAAQLKPVWTSPSRSGSVPGPPPRAHQPPLWKPACTSSPALPAPPQPCLWLCMSPQRCYPDESRLTKIPPQGCQHSRPCHLQQGLGLQERTPIIQKFNSTRHHINPRCGGSSAGPRLLRPKRCSNPKALPAISGGTSTCTS